MLCYCKDTWIQIKLESEMSSKEFKMMQQFQIKTVSFFHYYANKLNQVLMSKKDVAKDINK